MKSRFPNRGARHSPPFQGGESAQADGMVIQEPRSAPYFVELPNHTACAAKERDRFTDGAAPPPWKGACPSNGESAVGAVYEGVNECQAGNSPPDTGGVAAASIKCRVASLAPQTGWLLLTKCFKMHF